MLICRRITTTTSLFFVALCAFSPAGIAQDTQPAAAPPIETGTFRLHKFAQPIGSETYEVRKDGEALVTTSHFKFVDRGAPVILRTTLTTAEDMTPRALKSKGGVSRFTKIDDEIALAPGTAHVREGKIEHDVPVTTPVFTITGYAPVMVQQALLRFIATHKVTGALTTLPGGAVTVDARGEDAVTIAGKEQKLARFVVTGLIWGRETLWMDAANRLVALVSIDAEFDHFEAIRDGYEEALSVFIARAAADGMASLATMTGAATPPRKGPLAITNARLIDGTGAAPVSPATIVIDGDRIVAAGAAASVNVPAGATILDAHGQSVLPGLWDMHAHFEQVEWGPVYLAAGVTTVRDCGNEFDYLVSVRDVIKRGAGVGPRLLLAGIVDGDSSEALGVIRANNADEAHAVVAKYHDAGFQQIKIYSSMKKDVVAAICTEAHTVGMTVTGHIPNGMNAYTGVGAGMDMINHIQYVADVMKLKRKADTQETGPAAYDLDTPAVKKCLAFLKEHHTVVDPTAVIFEWMMHPASTPYRTLEPGVAKAPRELYANLNDTGAPAVAADRMGAQFDQYLAVIGALHKAGITIVAGTDQVVPGHSLHRELELYVKAGFTPLEAIQSATIVAARAMGMEKDLGTVEAGKIADLILVDGDPLASISNIRNVRTVITSGRVFECAPLWKAVGFKP